jgi:sugar lactone lactonase YvrE
MAFDTPFTCVLDVKASLGECALWSVADQALWWVDINAPSLNRFDPATGRNVAMPLSESIGCFAFRPRDGGFVLAMRDGLWLADARGRPTRKIVEAPFAPAHHRFNDGRCDRQGRFYAGSMNENRDAPTGALYRLDADLAFTKVLDGMTISNGLAWSPDGRTMYVVDSGPREVHAFAFDGADGTISDGRVLVTVPEEVGSPDGMTVDASGDLWVAIYGGGRVHRYTPTASCGRCSPFRPRSPPAAHSPDRACTASL